MKGEIRFKYALEIVVFMSGALVMIYEIIGSRIVSPYIGVSTYVWTSLIGVILGALSLGYWLGGKAADREPRVALLGFILFVAGGLVSVTILFKDVVLSMVAAGNASLEVRSLLAAILLFAPASIAFGFVTPYAVRLRMKSVQDSGKTVGRLYALSTVGSIAGTFAAGFFLIPFVGSVRTLYLIAATLFCLSVLMVPLALSKASVAAVTVFAIGVTLSEVTVWSMRANRELYDIDTEYSRVQVFRMDDPKTGRRMQAMATDPYFVQSAKYLDGPELAFAYNRFYHLVRYFKPDFRRTLMIGGAGYTFPQDYLRLYPEATMDVVEIDPQMTQIAERFFGLTSNSRLNIIHRDGRVFLNEAAPGQYDAVLMDAFGPLFSVPYHLTTEEAVRGLHKVLKDDGVVIFNLGSAIRGPGSRFLQAEFATYKKVFSDVLLFKVNADYSDESLQNLMIAACKTPCRNDSAAGDEEIVRLLSHLYTDEFPIELPVLTDDLAPVEHYNSFALNAYRR